MTRLEVKDIMKEITKIIIDIRKTNKETGKTELSKVYHIPLCDDGLLNDEILQIENDFDLDVIYGDSIEDNIFIALGQAYLYGIDNNYYFNNEHEMETDKYIINYTLKPLFK